VLVGLITKLSNLGILGLTSVLEDLIQTLADVGLQLLELSDSEALAPRRIIFHAFDDLAIAGDGGRSV